MKKKWQIIIITIIFLCLSVACVEKTINQNDTFYLIKLGEDIFRNGFTFTDHFSWINNLPYTYPHWLHTVYIYLIYNNFGFDGLYIFNIITMMGLMTSVYYTNYKINKDKFMALFISLISCVLLNEFINSRSISITCILFLWEIYYIINLIKTGKKKYIILLAIISLLIANIHGTVWIMYFVLFLPFIVAHLIYLIVKKKNLRNKLDYIISIEEISNIKLLLLAFVISGLMGLLTPSRICYTYFFKTIFSINRNFISEHLPTIIINYPFVIISLFSLYFSRKKIKLSSFFMISGLTLMTLLSPRHTSFFYTIGLLYISSILFKNIDKNDNTLKILYNKIFNNKIILTAVLIISLTIGVISFNNNSKKEYINKEYYPVEAVKFIKNNLDYNNMRLFNSYNEGSYILFNDIKVFVDSRCDLYFITFNHKKDIIKDFLEVYDNYQYEKIFNKYNIQYVLINQKDPLNYILNNDSTYQAIHRDDNYMVYEKKEA